MTPSISVIISTYNNRRYIKKKLAEIRRQSLFDKAEFIFVETGSPEREREQLAPACREHPNLKLVTEETRKTLYEAWNLGWNVSTAPLLCYSNMDDVMHPRLLEEVVNRMHKHSWDVCSVLIGIKNESEPLDWSSRRLARLPLCRLPGPFTAWRTGLQARIGQFDGSFVVRGDKDFWSRILAHRLRVGFIPKLLYLYNESPGQLSKSTAEKERRRIDKERLAAKPYPIRWPGKIRLQAALSQWFLPVWPRGFLVRAGE